MHDQLGAGVLVGDIFAHTELMAAAGVRRPL